LTLNLEGIKIGIYMARKNYIIKNNDIERVPKVMNK
jgi:hypothetical protein